MEELYDSKAARAYIAGKFEEQGDFSIIEAATFDKMLTRVMELDEAYMEKSGVDDGGVYDDDEAFEFMHGVMMEEFAEHKMYMMRLVEDYMEYNEAYLESIGAIDWE